MRCVERAAPGRRRAQEVPARSAVIAAIVTSSLLVGQWSCTSAPGGGAPPSIAPAANSPGTPGVPGERSTQPTNEPSLGPVVRVGLVSAVSRVRISSHRRWEIVSAARRESPTGVGAGEVLVFERSENGSVSVRDETGTLRGVFTGGVAAYPSTRGVIMRLGARAYRGYLVVLARSDGLTVVNRLHLEDYVRGVVSNEIGPGSRETLEALKAQTVAARTYAYAKIADRTDDAFDVDPTEMSQVYSGVDGETPWVNRAVDGTLGELLVHGGVVAEALYSSTCGGHTADAREVWGGERQGQLRGTPDRIGGGDLCASSRYYTWRVSWDGERLLDILGRYYPRIYPGKGRPGGRLLDLAVASRGRSGRVRELHVVTSNGRYTLDRDRIRWVLRRAESGEPALYSTMFDLDVVRRNGRVARVTANGHGWGHGVGMCQSGALAMSRAGYTYHEILGHYYRGAGLRRPYVDGA